MINFSRAGAFYVARNLSGFYQAALDFDGGQLARTNEICAIRDHVLGQPNEGAYPTLVCFYRSGNDIDFTCTALGNVLNGRFPDVQSR